MTKQNVLHELSRVYTQRLNTGILMINGGLRNKKIKKIARTKRISKLIMKPMRGMDKTPPWERIRESHDHKGTS